MFKTIFSFEFKRWIKSWQFYLYTGIFFLLGFFLMADLLGFFDSFSVTSTSLEIVNSPLMINALIEGMNRLMYFLFPTIIGASIYRDYKYNAHQIFYSYPFTKTNYLLGKFLSAFSITLLISIAIGLGIFIATLLPFGNQELLGPNIFWNYAQAYLWNVIPNMLLIGMIVFTVTTLSRSIYVGFISVIAIIILLSVVSSAASNLENEELAMLIDPTGMQSLSYYTKYWTIDELNTHNLPLEKWYILNRAIWLGVTAIFAGVLFWLFNFSQQPFQLKFRKTKAEERSRKISFVGLYQILLPKVTYDFSFKAHWNNVLNFTKQNVKYLIKNKAFLILAIIGILSMVSIATFSNMMYGTNTYPITRNIAYILSETFEIFLIANTFLAAGLLIHRGDISKMDGLVDVCPTPNWVFFLSSYFALILMQAFLLLIVLATGIGFQSFNGYFQLEIGLYLKILGVKWFYFIIWAGLAMAVQTIFKNYIVGFFVLILYFLFGNLYSKLGVEQDIFFFNRLPFVSYSDLNGFGSRLPKYFVYVGYWLLFIGFISGLTLLFWRRGVFSFKERFYLAKERANTKIILPSILCLIGFLGIGGYLYYENTILHPYYSSKDIELMQVEYEKQYKSLENLVQPRIVDVKVDLDIYPDTRDFEANGVYILENKNATPVDSIVINSNTDYLNEIKIENAELLSKDTIYGINFYRFNTPLDSGSVAKLEFKVKNKPNTILRNNSPVLGNGTFINNSVFTPSIGYSSAFEISNPKVREKYELPPKEQMPEQDDMEARENTYIRNDSDWITFETTVSTNEDQIAIAPGYLQKEWVENGRRYFHYSMGDQKILNFYAYNSGKYEVEKDKWNDINIEIYYSKKHPFNIDRMVSGLKKSFDYFTKEFGPYQFNQVRIIEFPSTMGSFAQSFANTIPFSENIGFIANVDDEEEDAVDYPFSVTSHELAHQWWAHQVIGANVKGATMLSESLSEYSSLKVLEHEYGKGQMRKFLKEALDRYLMSRSYERIKEQPLMNNENQQYIHYNKGSLVFYALSDYMGEKEMNKVLSKFIDKVAFKDAPHPVARELVADLKAAIPDSLQYMITDMFETITLYDNFIEDAEAKKLDDGTYEVEFKAIVSKYKTGDKGKRIYANAEQDSLVYIGKRDKEIKSLPLEDYIEIGIFADSKDTKPSKEQEKILYLEKVKITDMENNFKIIVNQEPKEVGVDPYNKLIDAKSYDNRKKVSVKK